MIPKKYTSFKEIDQDLKILKLEREIDLENLKMNFNQMKHSLYPSNIMGGFSGILKTFLISFFTKKILSRFGR